jgi:pyruvate/2-oxoacid:ferredoxin oxidoreductase alpha subunit
MKKVIMGNHAVSYGVRASDVKVISAYPITPQTQVVELLSEMCANGELDAKFIAVESEHSALTACVGASAAGSRTFTATSSQGLLLMHEIIHWAVGARLPIVMSNVNRAVGPPWSIWTDQNDSLSQRDTGWLQIYCESNQEVQDTIVQAFKIAETVMLPVMIVLDAFSSRTPSRSSTSSSPSRCGRFCRRTVPPGRSTSPIRTRSATSRARRNTSSCAT